MSNRKRELLAACCFAVAVSFVMIGPLTRPSVRAQVRRVLAVGVYEGETLATSGKILVSGGQAVSQPMDGFGQGWSGNAQLFWGGGQPGAVLDLILDVPDEAIYAVELNMTRAPDYGQLRIQVDGRDVKATFDGYASKVERSGPVALGTFDLRAGARKVSFMIIGKNEKATGFLAGIDFVRLTKKPVSQDLQPPTATYTERWEITGLSVSPPTTHISDKEMGYMDGDKLTVKCSYKRFEVGPNSGVKILISDNGSVKDSTGVTQEDKGATRTISYNVSGLGNHVIKCEAVVISKSLQSTVTDEKSKQIYVKGNKVTDASWATAPIIVKPTQNQKVSGGDIVVKPRNPSLSHCTDGGYFYLDWEYFDQSTSTWKPLGRRLSSLWKCVAEGSVKSISAMKPGLYKVKAKEANTKHNFESEWSDWVTFELLPPK